MSVKFKTFSWANEHFDEIETIEGTPRLYKTPVGLFPSMTSVLSVLKDENDKGFQEWRDRVGDEEADRITNEAIDRGNTLHDFNELYLQNKLKRSDLTGQARVLFNRVKHYLDEIELLIATEVALYHEDLQYAGRVDCVGMLHNELTIIDHKNSRRPINTNTEFGRKKLMKYMVQCAGYGLALHRMKGYKPTKGCLIVGNHLTSTSDRFIFDLEPLEKEVKIVVHAYHNDGEGIKDSMFFSL